MWCKLHQDHFMGKDVLAMDVERVEARLGRLENQYEYEEEAND